MNVMTDFETNEGQLKKLWVDTPVPTDIIAKGVRQIKQIDEWKKPTLKLTTWEMVKDYTTPIKLTAKFHK